MRDINTNEAIRVVRFNPSLPFLIVPYVQLDQIRKVLDEHRLRYEVSEETLSIDDGPEEIFVRFARGTDPEHVQRLLDSVEGADEAMIVADDFWLI